MNTKQQNLAMKAALLESMADSFDTGDTKKMIEAGIAEHVEAVQGVIRDTILSAIRSQPFTIYIRGLLNESAKDLVAERLAARMAELDDRIDAIVAERFEAAVEEAARAQLDVAIAAVKKAMVRP